jgi:hypothetical protein
MKHEAYLALLFDQIRWVCENLSSEEYQKPICLLHGASIGKHLRHILDGFQTVWQGNEEKQISFDCRQREYSLENDPNAAIERLNTLENNFSTCDWQKKIFLQSDFSTEGEERPFLTETTLQREMIYAIEHALHHLFIIRIGVEQTFEVRFPSEFGVAPATLRHLYQANLEKRYEKI